MIFMPLIPMILVRVALYLLAAFLSGAGAATAAQKITAHRKRKEAAARKKIRDEALARTYKDLS